MARLFKPLQKVKIKHFPWLIGFLLLVVIFFASFGSPAVMQLDPAEKQSKVTFNAPFTIHFSHIMNRSSVEQAFELLPRTEGRFEWKDMKTLEFHPDKMLTIGDAYRMVIKGSAKSIWMKQIGFDTTIEFLVTGPPYILFANPGNESVLAKDDVITVMFDRAVDWAAVKKEGLIETEPKIEGDIRLMGLSAFQFIPKKLSSGQTYSITVPAGLQALDGGLTEEDFSWAVTTPSLKVSETRPLNGDTEVPLDTPLQILFDDEVPLEGIKPGTNALLYPSNDLDALTERKLDGFFNTEVTYGADEDGTVRRDVLIFEPTFPYQPDETYRFVLRSDDDLRLEEDFELSFETPRTKQEEIQPPKETVVETVPALSWQNNGMDFFIRGENPRLELSQPLKEITTLVACPVPSNQFMRISARQGWDDFDCENDAVTLNPFEKDLTTTINLNDYFNFDWVTGVYFASMTQGDETIHREFLIKDSTLLLKRSANDLLVWALDVKSGEPIAGMDLEILDYEGELVVKGQTDEAGVFTLSRPLEAGIYVRGKKEEDEVSRWAFVSDGWHLDEIDSEVSADGNEIFVQLSQDIFAPGDTIGIKGIWRTIKKQILDLPEGTQVNISIEDSRHNFIVSKRVPMRRNGSFDSTILLPQDTGPGYYLVTVADLNNQQLSRPLPIQIRHATDLKLEWAEAKSDHSTGEAPVYIVKARYKNGIPAANLKGYFELFRRPLAQNHQVGSVSYRFNALDADCKKDCGEMTLVSRDDFEFDRDGEASLVLTEGDKAFLRPDHLYELQVTALLSASKQSSVNMPFTIHQGSFDLGLGLKHALIGVDDNLEAGVLSLDHAGEAIDNKRVKLSLMSTDAHPKTIYEDSFDTVNGVTDVSIPLVPQLIDGIYLLRAESRDEKNNTIAAEQPVYLNRDPTQALSDELFLAPDQAKYFVGGRAHLLLNVPEASEEKPASVLMTYERDGLLGYESLLVRSPVTRITVPIEETMVPRFIVSASRFQRGLDAAFEAASQEIEVGIDESRIFVELSFEPEDPEPGDEVDLNIYTHDYQNRPVASVLTLNLTDSPLPEADFSHQFFYPLVSRPMQGASSISLMSHPQAPIYPEQAENYALSPAKSFSFEPLVATGENGETKFTFTLPDKRLDLYLQALATRGAMQMGSGSVMLKMNHQLQIEPILPSFAIPGDQTVFAASIKNISDQPVQSRLELIPSGFAVKGDSARSLSLDPGQQTEVIFNVFVDKNIDAESLPVVFRSEADEVALELPLKHLRSSVRVLEKGMLGDIWTGRIHLPKEAYPGLGELSLAMSGVPRISAAIHSEALEYYPYDSTYLLAVRLLIKLSSLSDTPEESEPTSIRALVSSLLKKADENGAYRFWDEEDASPTLSTLALLAYLEASEADIHVDSLHLNRSTDSLWRLLDSENLAPEDQLFSLWVLSKNEQYDTERTINLFQQRESISPRGKAFMLMNLDELVRAGQGSVAGLFDILKAELADEAIQTESLAYFDGPDKETAVVLFALSELDGSNPILQPMANYLSTLGDDLINSLDLEEVLWLNLALKQYGNVALQPSVNYITQVKINGSLVLDQSLAGNTADEIYRTSLGAEILNTEDINDIFVKKNGTGPLYMDVHLTSYLDPRQVLRTEDGMLIIRQLFELGEDGKKIPAQTFRRGKQYLSQLEIIVPRDHEYVALSDAIPAGMKVHAHKQNLSPPFNQLELEDDRITYFATYLPAGVYTIGTQLQAAWPGNYLHLPARIQAIFEPDTVGQTEGGTIQIID